MKNFTKLPFRKKEIDAIKSHLLEEFNKRGFPIKKFSYFTQDNAGTIKEDSGRLQYYKARFFFLTSTFKVQPKILQKAWLRTRNALICETPRTFKCDIYISVSPDSETVFGARLGWSIPVFVAKIKMSKATRKLTFNFVEGRG